MAYQYMIGKAIELILRLNSLPEEAVGPVMSAFFRRSVIQL